MGERERERKSERERKECRREGDGEPMRAKRMRRMRYERNSGEKKKRRNKTIREIKTETRGEGEEVKGRISAFSKSVVRVTGIARSTTASIRIINTPTPQLTISLRHTYPCTQAPKARERT